MGMALTSCTVPAAGKPTFEIGDDEMEIGIGIHGEPGRERRKLATADEITEMLAIPILDDLPFESGDRVLAFVNGMGGTPLIELYVVYNKLAELARARRARSRAASSAATSRRSRWRAARSPCSSSTTSSSGCWDAPVNTPALRWGV